MKQNKQSVWFLFILFLFVSNSFAIKKQNSFFSYLCHPATLLCTGLASVSGYCLYNKTSSSYAYEWLKQRFNETPELIKWCGAGLGILGCYTFWYYNQSISGTKSELMHELNKQDLRIRIISTKNYSQLHDMMRMLNQCFMRLSNLEQILEYKTNENSFGFGAKLQKNRLDRYNERLNDLEDSVSKSNLREKWIEDFGEMFDDFKINAKESIIILKNRLEEDETVLYEQGEEIVRLQETFKGTAQAIKDIRLVLLRLNTKGNNQGNKIPPRSPLKKGDD